MRHPARRSLAFLLAAAFSIGLPSTGHAQFLKKLKDAAKDAAEDETMSQVDRMVREGVACVFDDLDCIQRAQESGDDVYLTDEAGDPVVDDDGNTVSNPDQAAEILGKTQPSAPGARPGVLPGEGATTNLDFVPGESTIVGADYSEDNLGDFPRRFDLISGSFDVIEWQGARYVRALSNGTFAIVLPRTLPEKFTLETSVSIQHGNGFVAITPGRAYNTRPLPYRGSAVVVRYAKAGLDAVKNGGPVAMTGHDHDIVRTRVAPLQVMADGEHMKVYLDDRRVANVPNAVFPRTDTLFVAVSSASEEYPILLGSIRIAGGGADLYDRLAREGRVTTRGILFDVNSDAIRIESAPTLEEIGTMLQDHPELRISIEGHTDSDGDEAFNEDLSRRRAASVKQYLVDTYDVDPARLETAGYGESRPVAPNDTPEGKQQNRRVELVRL
jgi:outer membrane protein OmpA-like peptidoglycan-associated protein